MAGACKNGRQRARVGGCRGCASGPRNVSRTPDAYKGARMSALTRRFRRRSRQARTSPRLQGAGPADRGRPTPAPVEIAPNDPLLAYFQGVTGAVDIDALELDSPALRGAEGGRREARRAARQPGRADRRAQPRPAPVRAGLLLRRPQAARQPRRPGRAGAAGRPARARAGGRGRDAPALRAGARGRAADPAELPAQGAARPARLAGRRLLPAGARGRRRLLRRDPAGRRPRRRSSSAT